MEEDKKYKRIGWWTALLSQVILLILFYFLIAWKEPSPPIPSYGIELSFGFSETGSGDVPVSTLNPDDIIEETDEVEPSEETESVAEETTEPTESVDAVEEVVPEEVITQQPSPDVIPKIEEQKKPVVEPKVVEKEQKKTTVAEAKSPVEPGPVNNPSQGTTAQPGDQGKPEAKLDDRALYGNQGSGTGGASLQMAGWVWDFKPKPNDKSTESGKIVYRIKIDDEGYIVDIEVVTSTVTPALERLYRQSVEKLSFSKTNDYKPAATSTGTITFLIQTK